MRNVPTFITNQVVSQVRIGTSQQKTVHLSVAAIINILVQEHIKLVVVAPLVAENIRAVNVKVIIHGTVGLVLARVLSNTPVQEQVM